MDTSPAVGGTVPTTGDTVLPTEDAAPVNGAAAPATGENVPPAAETLTTKITSSVDITPASEAPDEAKAKFQGSITRSKTEFTEAMNKTGTVVQRRIVQGVQEAKVVVEKVRPSPLGVSRTFRTIRSFPLLAAPEPKLLNQLRHR